ncbi:uncharacterized protein LOC123723087 [Papilio machaon]|uniref:uncharacterized protein LOC123723087 n=1 Tax=Papilio machaon TaxID=76193 RepID=UPI001E664C00|nr:uncharacterized protein LOC123723087 [Papilio machaon]
MAPHTGSATPEQIDVLLNFLDEHRDLARGRLRGADGNVQTKRLWQELCNSLNSMGGCTKTIQQWQKVWFDRKHLAKKAAADSRRSTSATGGGPSLTPPLSQWQVKVLSIMGDGFGGRQTTARVPAFSEANVPSTSSHVPPQSQLSLDLPEVMEYVVPSQEDIQSTQLMSQSQTPRSSSQPARSRRRQSATGSDVRRRLFQLEEERAGRETALNTELAGIRVALEQLCGLMRKFLEK